MIEYDTLKYSKIEVSNDLLSSFEEEGFTYLHCTYITSPKYVSGWWVNMHQTSYLTTGKGDEKLTMLNAMNIPLAPKKHYFKKFGDSLKFTLIFPAVPKQWKVFDFVEDCAGSDGLNIKNITRNSTGVYKVFIS